MGTFCFDQYDHPLLWCEEKKRYVERRNAEESTRLWQRKKAEENARKERDKQEYHEMVVSHCPWGRPGGGAPNLDVRMRNITAEGLHPTPKYGARGSHLPPCHINVVGGGPQIRSAADHLYITLKDHPSMTFRNKGHVDIELRYKPQPQMKPKMQLEKITVTEKPKSKEKKKSAVEDNNPWGKAGPGGAPWRNPKSVGSSFMRSLGWTNKELLKELDQENPQTTPSEKPVKKSKPQAEPVRKCCPLCSCKCGSTTSESEPIRPPVKRHSLKENGTKTEAVQTAVRNRSSSPTKTAAHKKSKPVTFKRSGGPGGCGLRKPPNNACPVANEGVELVPLLARRRGMHRPVSLSSTDVTKRTDCNRLTTAYDVEYLSDLKRQMAQKFRRVKLTKEQEMDLCNKHFKTFEEFWGRPGHGAPRNIKTKLNLDDLLYGVST